ncbi:MAG: SMI1/KNR4 family protein [Abitibacteriaceae bacterium]|nr:SMI1/KNR4 family protein [Abditibacteriaceae bacterium]MBV9867976.1 SMI1/KNR4 family protein [Abditibacteriaceae bacterium]
MSLVVVWWRAVWLCAILFVMREYFRVTAAGASLDALNELQQQLGHVLPDAYLALLRETNGAEWGVHDVSGDCLQLWKAQEVPELNAAYEIQRWLPGVVAIASDGSGRAIILDTTIVTEPNLWPVLRVEFGALERDEFTPVATNFLAWVEREFRLPSSS